MALKTNTKANDDTLSKIDSILEHIKHVQENCYRLGAKLIKAGEVELGRRLIANGQIHDNSKFHGTEFKHLFEGDKLLREAIDHHAVTNPHHPEFWDSIHAMPMVYIAEMVCDCAARGAEFGTDIRAWFAESATVKYGFKMEDAVGKNITKYLDLLLSKQFKTTKKKK